MIQRCEKTFYPSGNGIEISRKSISQISYCTDNGTRAPTLLYLSLVNFLEVNVYFCRLLVLYRTLALIEFHLPVRRAS
jgi:hypothetical protein